MQTPSSAAPTLESHLQAQVDRVHDFFWHRLRWSLVARTLPSDETCRLLDVGAGAGLAGEYLTEGFPRAEYFFIEPLESLETRLVERFGPRRNLRGHSSFSGMRYLLLLDVLEHQEDDRGFLADLIAKMDSGSRLLVTVPALRSLWSDWDRVLGHFRRYDKRTLAAAVNGLPVVIEELSFVFPEMVPMGLLRRYQARSAGSSHGEFPQLPGWINEALFRFGTVSLALRRAWPFGSSLYLRIRKQ
jgi:hypothetical protein